MKIPCDYCGSYISDTDSKCPHCGATNEHMRRTAEGVPTTIRELQDFCDRHSMPLRQMRFFIGEDCQAPRAFGIYQDRNGDFVVYKNKSDGSRAVRYCGKDEAYAVNELYQKLKVEVQLRRINDQRNRPKPMGSRFSSTAATTVRKSVKRIGCMYLIVILITMLLVSGTFFSVRDRVHSPVKGYYSYQNNDYFYNSGSWYTYNDALGVWDDTTAADELRDHSSRYWEGNRADGDLTAHPEESTYTTSNVSSDSYDSSSSWDNDWDDDDWDYDYDSWDSGNTDWDSDW